MSPASTASPAHGLQRPVRRVPAQRALWAGLVLQLAPQASRRVMRVRQGRTPTPLERLNVGRAWRAVLQMPRHPHLALPVHREAPLRLMAHHPVGVAKQEADGPERRCPALSVALARGVKKMAPLGVSCALWEPHQTWWEQTAVLCAKSATREPTRRQPWVLRHASCAPWVPCHTRAKRHAKSVHQALKVERSQAPKHAYFALWARMRRRGTALLVRHVLRAPTTIHPQAPRFAPPVLWDAPAGSLQVLPRVPCAAGAGTPQAVRRHAPAAFPASPRRCRPRASAPLVALEPMPMSLEWRLV